jgi:hypothetical protein
MMQYDAAEWQCDSYCWRALCVQSLADYMRIAAAIAAVADRHDAVSTNWQLRLNITHAAAAQQHTTLDF